MKFSFINSARGIAILMVVTLHVSQLITMEGYWKLLKFFCNYGQLGVQFFFIASAYTLCLSADHRKSESHTLRNFYIRRYFRIFPVYYLGIIVYYLMNLFYQDAESYTFKNVFANVLFIHGFIPSANNKIVPGGWSIATEMLFYLIFPVLHWFLFSGKIIFRASLIVCACFLGLYLLQIKVDNNTFWYYNIITQLPVFVVGIVYYKYVGQISLMIGFALFALFTLVTLFFWQFRWFEFVPLSSGISFCGLLKILEKTSLDHPFFQKIGKVSYSIYVVHFIFAFFLLPENQSIVWFLPFLVVTFALSYFISVLLEKYIEKPFIKIGSKLTSASN